MTSDKNRVTIGWTRAWKVSRYAAPCSPYGLRRTYVRSPADTAHRTSTYHDPFQAFLRSRAAAWNKDHLLGGGKSGLYRIHGVVRAKV